MSTVKFVQSVMQSCSIETPTFFDMPPLSSCSNRWSLGDWANKIQQQHKRPLQCSFDRVSPLKRADQAPGPAPTLADAWRDHRWLEDLSPDITW